MSSAQVRPALAGFRDMVTELTGDGWPFRDVEDAINAQPALTVDQKAALWLFAFSLRDRSGKQRQARALLAVAGEASAGERYLRHLREVRSGSARAEERARPREFDAKGFPVPQRSRSFLERVAQLLNPEPHET
jgi:hypothetical protein